MLHLCQTDSRQDSSFGSVYCVDVVVPPTLGAFVGARCKATQLTPGAGSGQSSLGPGSDHFSKQFFLAVAVVACAGVGVAIAPPGVSHNIEIRYDGNFIVGTCEYHWVQSHPVDTGARGAWCDVKGPFFVTSVIVLMPEGKDGEDRITVPQVKANIP
jgi:hypothetical protein